jgi:hypothetical protein
MTSWDENSPAAAHGTGWAPVVYGRTASSDTWWQAVPEGLDEAGWLSTAVHAAIAGGHELAGRPRFLLAQDAAHRIVGVACQASDLSADMYSDGYRDLFCFVGWVARRSGALNPGCPELGEFQRCYRQWAAPVYAEVMTPVWSEPSTIAEQPRLTRRAPVPWNATSHYASQPGPLPEEGMWPQETWDGLWTAVEAAKAPFVCVAGWQHTGSARSDDATHLGVADAPARQAPAPPRRTPPALIPSQRTADTASRPRAPASPLLDRFEQPLILPADLPTGSPTLPSTGKLGLRPRTKLTAVVALVALALAGALIIVTSGSGPARRPAVPQAQPTVMGITISASGKPAGNSLFRYSGKALTAGPGTVRMAAWTVASPPGRSACMTRLKSAVAKMTVRPSAGTRICIELKGKPARYGIVKIMAVSTSSVTATATIWP